MGLLKQGSRPYLSYEGLQQVIYSNLDTLTATSYEVAVIFVYIHYKKECPDIGTLHILMNKLYKKRVFKACEARETAVY